MLYALLIPGGILTLLALLSHAYDSLVSFSGMASSFLGLCASAFLVPAMLLLYSREARAKASMRSSRGISVTLAGLITLDLTLSILTYSLASPVRFLLLALILPTLAAQAMNLIRTWKSTPRIVNRNAFLLFAGISILPVAYAVAFIIYGVTHFSFGLM